MDGLVSKNPPGTQHTHHPSRGDARLTRAAHISPAGDLQRTGERQATYLALGIATVIYIAIALGVFGTLTVEKVIASGGTALVVAAEPALGKVGYWLMSITVLFATAGATNAGLYPAPGLCERLAETGQFPPLLARKLGGRASNGLLLQAAVCVVLAVAFKLDAIAAAAVVLVTFIFTTLIHEPASIVTLLGAFLLSIGLDLGWKRTRTSRPGHAPVGHQSFSHGPAGAHHRLDGAGASRAGGTGGHPVGS
jgi:amino acid transporter